jgi:hypothetical protein
MDEEERKQRDYMISQVDRLQKIVKAWPPNGDIQWKVAKGIIESLNEAI